MDRRGFLSSILAACAAPAIVRADSLMRIVPMETLVISPDAAWVGAVRELTAWDIFTDEQLIRFDVAGRNHQGILVQETVTVRGFDFAENRAAGLQMLKDRVQRAKMRPMSGILRDEVGDFSVRFV